jgi:hypothetical protein
MWRARMAPRRAPRIVILCSVAQQVPLVTPVADLLAARGWTVEMLSLDAFTGLDVTPAIRRTPHRWHELRNPMPPSSNQTAATLATELDRRARAYFADGGGAVLLLCNDVGHLERTVLRRAESSGWRTALLQHGTFTTDQPAPREHLVHYDDGDAGVDLICAWGDGFAGRLRARGVGGQVTVTGNPRYDTLTPDMSRSRTPAAGASVRVVVAAQAWSRYGYGTETDEIAVYTRIIEILLEQPRVNVVLKLHPQQHQAPYRRLAAQHASRLDLVAEGDSLELLRTADAAVTVTSTFGLEAVLMGVPTVLLSYLETRYELPDFADYPFRSRSELEFRDSVRDPGFPEMLSLTGPQVTHLTSQLAHRLDGLAATRVADALTTLAAPVRKTGETPVMTVLVWWRRDDHDTAAALATLLRQDGVTVTVLNTCHDASPILSTLGEHPTLRVLEVADRSPHHAIAVALGRTDTELIAWFEASCLALPGWAPGLANALERHPDATIATSAYFACNHLRVGRWLVRVPDGPMTHTVFACRRRNALDWLAVSNATADETDLLRWLLGAGRLVVDRGALYRVDAHPDRVTLAPASVPPYYGTSPMAPTPDRSDVTCLDGRPDLLEEWQWNRRRRLAEELARGFDLRWTAALPAQRPLLLWGAGERGRELADVLTRAGRPADGFIDKDRRKRTAGCLDRPVYAPDALQSLEPRPFVLIASMFSGEVRRGLCAAGFREGHDFLAQQ